MPRIAIGIEYDGTAFAGWQRQGHARSVQGELEAARAFGMSRFTILHRIWFPRAFRLVLPTLGGEAEIRVPVETQTGKVFRLREKGVKSVRSRGVGDLYCRVVVETPVNLTGKQRELLEQFEQTFTGENASRHSPRSSTFIDGVKSFWERMTS